MEKTIFEFFGSLDCDIKCSYIILDFIRDNIDDYKAPESKVPTVKVGKLFEMGSIENNKVYLDPQPLYDLGEIQDLDGNTLFNIDIEELQK